MPECLFCKIARHEAPAQILLEDDRAMAFRDIAPQAPVHVLVIPKKHLTNLFDATEEDVELLGHLLHLGAQIAEREGMKGRGYRTVVNSGAEAGQSVFHLHLHMLGGRPMRWPPG
jgi:histidine triad (HIT) family protein